MVARGATRLIVAGGGGGGPHGGSGGAGGQNGLPGQKSSPDGTSTPGQGGTAGGAGGAGGVGSGTGGPGAAGDGNGQGGVGGIGGDAGGGGGGGWAGGGGGGGGLGTGNGGGTGGGGGSSFGPAGTAFSTGVRTGNGQVIITHADPTCMPAISLVKSRVGTGPVTLGTTVTYNFLVTNTGNTTLTAVAVTDPLPRLSPVVCPVTTLAPAASTTCTATYVVDQADVTAGVINNTAMATGQPPPGYPAPTASDNETVAVDAPAAPGISLVKSRSGTAPATVGTTLTYNFLVTNTGNVTLTAVTVTDPLAGLSAVSCPNTTLTAGQAMTCTATYVVTQADLTAGSITNTATATGQPAGGGTPPTAVDSETVPVVAAAMPGISLAKTRSGTGPATIGSTITYNFLVTNTGNVTLTDVTVTDPLPRLSAVSCPGTTLTTGQAMTCTATYVVTQADADAGSIINTATATAQGPTGSTPPVASDGETVVVPGPVPSLPVVMTLLLAGLLAAVAVWRLRQTPIAG